MFRCFIVHQVPNPGYYTSFPYTRYRRKHDPIVIARFTTTPQWFIGGLKHFFPSHFQLHRLVIRKTFNARIMHPNRVDCGRKAWSATLGHSLCKFRKIRRPKKKKKKRKPECACDYEGWKYGTRKPAHPVRSMRVCVESSFLRVHTTRRGRKAKTGLCV